ncbi:hypothetical protein B0O99DRAFT_692075 [Bisporella sp. PMI_857]|nr:hypothetical protein B0O99DRAFT_692075 [Bisporella sp. PMI_857]
MLGLVHFLVVSLLALLANCYEVNFVYRADTRPWDVIKKDGGFRTKADTNKLKPDYSLYIHAAPVGGGATAKNDGYVSTSWDETVCKGWVTGQLGGTAYVYKISTNDHFVDVASTLGKYNPFPKEKEYAVKDSIQWRFVSEWTEYVKGKPQQTVRNKDFDIKTIKWNANGPQFELAGFPASHKAWSEEPWKSTKANPNKKSSSKSSKPYIVDPPKKESSKPKPYIVDPPTQEYSKPKPYIVDPPKPYNVVEVAPKKGSKYYKKSDTMGGRQDLVHFAQIRAAKAAANEE